MNYQYLSTSKSKNKNQAGRGFTLVELLVVISIVAFLATIMAVGLNDSRTKSLDTRRVSDIYSIQKGLSLYFNDQRTFPPGNSVVLGSVNATCLAESGFSGICPPGERIYMALVPANPGPGGANYVYSNVGGVDYTLDFALETNIGSLEAGPHTLSTSGFN